MIEMILTCFRRVKVLTFVILLVALNRVYSTDNLDVPGLLHLVKIGGDDGEEGLCIAFDEDAYSAIEWTYPIPDDENDLPKTVSSYLPSESSPFDCTFEEDEECNKIWNVENWTIPIHSSRNYLPIFDTRWEDFKTYITTNKTKINENRFEIPKDSNLGISVRSEHSVDILLCQGYNPETYPCYTITLGGATKKEVFIKRDGVNETLAKYKSNFPILSPDEWRNFNLSLSKTGQIQLEELNKNSLYLNVTDATPLDTLYLFMHSSLPSLWKIHKNHFLYTNASQFVPFGPKMHVTGSTICLSMYLIMCRSCSIFFYKIKDLTTDVILEVNSAEEDTITYEWKHVKIMMENVTDDTVELFVKTHSNASDRFWAIDNLRNCISGEFKIRKLSKPNSNRQINFQDQSFSCHSLKFPEWRPKQQVINMTGLPIVNSFQNTTSIQLSWQLSYPQPFIVNFKGSDICSRDTIPQFKNRFRLISNGWIVVKPKEKDVNIENLVPYTHYSVLLIDPIFDVKKTLPMNTNPTDKPSSYELPLISIKPNAKQAIIQISPRKCNVSYGPIVYGLNVMQQPNYRVIVDENMYTWKNLTANTNYTLVVHIARTIKNLNNTDIQIVKYYNFTTKPDVASQLDFVESYEVSETSASFRYRLPGKANGQPVLIQVRSCTKLKKDCDSSISSITPCPLWRNLFCVTIDKLMKRASYTFKLSIKNNNTNTFGKELQIIRRAVENVPGVPGNLSYNVIDCVKDIQTCNLNVSWSHPYNQSGVILFFEIFLIGDVSKIEEVPIRNQYSPVYWYLIRGIPFAKSYNMSIRACNSVHKGLFASIPVQIDHIADHIDHTPKMIGRSENTITFQFPKLDNKLNSSNVTVIVQQNDNMYAEIPRKLISTVGNSLCLSNRTTWIASTWKMSHDSVTNVTLGSNDETLSALSNNMTVNKPLSPNIDYCINFVIRSIYKGTEHIKIYYKKHIILTESHQSSEKSNTPVTNTMSTGLIVSITILLLLLIAAITVFGVLLYRKRIKNRSRTRSEGQHIYEAMPEDDFNDSCNVVYNALYDKLNHD